jgi:hypothetical protein
VPCGPGWKTSKSVSFSPTEANRIGAPVTSRTDSAAPPRASPSSLDRITPSKPTWSLNAFATLTASWPIIASMTNSVWVVDGLADRAGLGEQLVVDVQASGGVDDDDVAAGLAGLGRSSPGHGHRVTRGHRRVDVHPGPLGVDLELLDGCGSLQVAGDQHRPAPLGLEHRRELAGRGGLARALEAGEHDDRGMPSSRSSTVSPPSARSSSAFDGLDDVLGRVERLGDLVAEQLLAQALEHPLDDLEVHVRIEQGQADLTQGRVDRLLVEPPTALEPVERGVELGAERVEHGDSRCGADRSASVAGPSGADQAPSSPSTNSAGSNTARSSTASRARPA